MLINLDAIGALIAIPIIIKVIGTVANESFIIILDVIIPPNKTTAIGGKAAIVEDIQITIKFLLNITKDNFWLVILIWSHVTLWFAIKVNKIIK